MPIKKVLTSVVSKVPVKVWTDEVEMSSNQSDLVEIVATLRQIVCVKG